MSLRTHLCGCMGRGYFIHAGEQTPCPMCSASAYRSSRRSRLQFHERQHETIHAKRRKPYRLKAK